MMKASDNGHHEVINGLRYPAKCLFFNSFETVNSSVELLQLIMLCLSHQGLSSGHEKWIMKSEFCHHSILLAANSYSMKLDDEIFEAIGIEWTRSSSAQQTKYLDVQCSLRGLNNWAEFLTSRGLSVHAGAGVSSPGADDKGTCGSGGGGGGGEAPADDSDFYDAGDGSGVTRSGARYKADLEARVPIKFEPAASSSVKASPPVSASGGGVSSIPAEERVIDMQALMSAESDDNSDPVIKLNDLRLFERLPKNIQTVVKESKKFQDLLLQYLLMIIDKYHEKTSDARLSGFMAEWSRKRGDIERKHREFSKVTRVTQVIPWCYLFTQFLSVKFNGTKLPGETGAHAVIQFCAMKVTNLAEVKSLEQNVKRFQAVISESSSALSPEVFTMIVLSRLESSSYGLARSIGKAIREQFVTNNSNRLGRLNNLELVFQIVQKQAADTAIKEEQSRTDDERGGRDYRRNDKSSYSRSRSNSNSSRQQSAQQAHVAQGSGRKEKEQTGRQEKEMIGRDPKKTCSTCGHPGHYDAGFKGCPKHDPNLIRTKNRRDGSVNEADADGSN